MGRTSTYSETIDLLFDTTWPDLQPGVQDCYFRQYPFWAKMKADQRVKTGGRDLRINLEIGESNIQSIGKGDTVDTTEPDIASQVVFPWRELSGNVNRFRTEDADNAGSNRIIDLLQWKRDNVAKSMAKKINYQMIRSDGTGNNNKDLYGLALLISLTPTTGTVGSLNRANDTFFRNKARTSQSPASVYLIRDLKLAYNDLYVDEGEAPNFWLVDRTCYELYESCAVALQTIDLNARSKQMVDLGFPEHRVFKGAPMFVDKDMVAGYSYGLNTNALEWHVHRDFNMAWTGWKEPHNQPFDKSSQVVIRGNIVSSNPRRLIILSGIAE